MANEKKDNINSKTNNTKNSSTKTNNTRTNSKTKISTNTKVVKKKNITKKEDINTKNNSIKTDKNKKSSNKKENKIKSIISSEKFLLGVFVVLLIIVVILGILVFTKENNVKTEEKANIVFPLIEIGEVYDFSVSAASLGKDDYIFKIINYKDGKVVDTDIPYKITIENKIGATISLIKDDNNKNLIDNQEKTTISEESLGTTEENSVLYHLKIDSDKKFDKNDLIQIKIES